MNDLLKREIPWGDRASYFLEMKKEAGAGGMGAGAALGALGMGTLAHHLYKRPKNEKSLAERVALRQLRVHRAGIDPGNKAGRLHKLKETWIKHKVDGSRQGSDNPMLPAMVWSLIGAGAGAALGRKVKLASVNLSESGITKISSGNYDVSEYEFNATCQAMSLNPDNITKIAYSGGYSREFYLHNIMEADLEALEKFQQKLPEEFDKLAAWAGFSGLGRRAAGFAGDVSKRVGTSIGGGVREGGNFLGSIRGRFKSPSPYTQPQIPRGGVPDVTTRAGQQSFAALSGKQQNRAARAAWWKRHQAAEAKKGVFDLSSSGKTKEQLRASIAAKAKAAPSGQQARFMAGGGASLAPGGKVMEGGKQVGTKMKYVPAEKARAATKKKIVADLPKAEAGMERTTARQMKGTGRSGLVEPSQAQRAKRLERSGLAKAHPEAVAGGEPSARGLIGGKEQPIETAWIAGRKVKGTKVDLARMQRGAEKARTAKLLQAKGKARKAHARAVAAGEVAPKAKGLKVEALPEGGFRAVETKAGKKMYAPKKTKKAPRKFTGMTEAEVAKMRAGRPKVTTVKGRETVREPYEHTLKSGPRKGQTVTRHREVEKDVTRYYKPGDPKGQAAAAEAKQTRREAAREASKAQREAAAEVGKKGKKGKKGKGEGDVETKELPSWVLPAGAAGVGGALLGTAMGGGGGGGPAPTYQYYGGR